MAPMDDVMSAELEKELRQKELMYTVTPQSLRYWRKRADSAASLLPTGRASPLKCGQGRY